MPPDLNAPQYDDRYTVSTASGLAAQSTRPRVEGIAVNATPEARIVRGGTERWLVVKSTPQEAWNTMRKFWTDIGFVLAVEQPTLGIMETDWAENRIGMPIDAIEGMIGKVADVFSTATNATNSARDWSRAPNPARSTSTFRIAARKWCRRR